VELSISHDVVASSSEQNKIIVVADQGERGVLCRITSTVRIADLRPWKMGKWMRSNHRTQPQI